MTSLVGILCRDGVVIGADSSVTHLQEGQRVIPTIEQPYEKIDIVGDHVIVVGTGQIGLGQRFLAVVKEAWGNRAFQNDPIAVGKILSANAIKDFNDTAARTNSFGALVAFPVGNNAHLTEFAISDFQPEMKTEKMWFSSMGSAKYITDTFLAFLREVFWPNELPNISGGIFAAKWTLDHAVAINAGGVNGPVRISVLERVKGQFHARIIPDDELLEHAQAITDAKASLARFRNEHALVGHAEIPPVPQLPKIESIDGSNKEESVSTQENLPRSAARRKQRKR